MGAGCVPATGAGSDDMPRPEQAKDTKMAKAHKGKHGGEVKDGRAAGGAFAPGNDLAKGNGERISAGKQLRNAMRDQLGEQRIRDLTEAVYEIAMSSVAEPKDRLKAVDLLLGYTIGKPNGASAMEIQQDDKKNLTVRFVQVDQDGNDHEL